MPNSFSVRCGLMARSCTFTKTGLLSALDFHLSTPKEIVLIGDPEAAETRALAREVWRRYLPNKVVAQAAAGDESAASLIPLLRDRPALGGRPTAYVCENYTCQQP